MVFRGVERNHEGAVGADCTGADHVAVGILDGDDGVGFAFAADGVAVGADRKISRGRRSAGVAGVDAGRWRDVARRIGQGGRQGFAVGLRWGQGDDEVAIGADGAGANHIAIGILDGDRGVGFTLAADGTAISTDGQIARCDGGCGVARGDGAGSRNVARSVSEADLDCFTIGLRGVQVDLEVTISADRARADNAATGVLDCHRRTRFAATTEYRAGGVEGQASRGVWRRRVGVTATATAAPMSTEEYCCGTADTQQAQPPRQPVWRGAARRRSGHQVFKGADFAKGKTGIRRGVAPQEQGSVVVLQDQLVGFAIAADHKEVMDRDRATGLQGDDQILARLLHRLDAARANGHFYNTGSVQGDITERLFGRRPRRLVDNYNILHRTPVFYFS